MEDVHWWGRPDAWDASDVVDKYEDLLWRQPNVYDITIGQLRDSEGVWTKAWGITVWVTEKVDQNTLPSQDRIPAGLKGDHFEGDVHIQIVETEQPPRVPESNCDYSKCVVKLEEGEENMTNPNANPREDRAERARRNARELKVRDKYEPLFRRQPNVYATSLGLFTDDNDEFTGESGIVVSVTRRVDQSTLPPEDRIPDCLEGVPVQIKEEYPVVRSTSSI